MEDGDIEDGREEEDLESSTGDCRLLAGMGMLCGPEPDIV